MKTKPLTIQLTPGEHACLVEFARQQREMHQDELGRPADITPERILAAFVADLVGSNRSNGSDERDLAEQWYYRTWMGAGASARYARLSAPRTAAGPNGSRHD